MRMLRNEDLWLCIAAVGLLLMFERWSVLEVKSGEVVASQVSFWCIKREVKKINVSDVGKVGIGSTHGGKGGSLPKLLVYTKRGELFYTMIYNNGFTANQRIARDVDRFKDAMVHDTGFCVSRNESGLWVVLVVISLVVSIYKRLWRLERQRQAGNVC